MVARTHSQPETVTAATKQLHGDPLRLHDTRIDIDKLITEADEPIITTRCTTRTSALFRRRMHPEPQTRPKIAKPFRIFFNLRIPILLYNYYHTSTTIQVVLILMLYDYHYTSVTTNIATSITTAALYYCCHYTNTTTRYTRVYSRSPAHHQCSCCTVIPSQTVPVVFAHYY